MTIGKLLCLVGLRHVISGILAGGIPGFRMVLLLLHSPSGMAWFLFDVLPLFLLPYHVEMIQCYHLLHELAHELAPVTPWFCGFVLCCCVSFCVGGFVFGWCFVLFGGDFVTAYWTALRSCTSSPLGTLTPYSAFAKQGVCLLYVGCYRQQKRGGTFGTDW